MFNSTKSVELQIRNSGSRVATMRSGESTSFNAKNGTSQTLTCQPESPFPWGVREVLRPLEPRAEGPGSELFPNTSGPVRAPGAPSNPLFDHERARIHFKKRHRNALGRQNGAQLGNGCHRIR